MNKPTVFAVMRVTLEIPVRASSSDETLAQMHEAAKREAEGVIRNRLPTDVRVVGGIEFSHAIIKGTV